MLVYDGVGAELKNRVINIGNDEVEVERARLVGLDAFPSIMTRRRSVPCHVVRDQPRSLTTTSSKAEAEPNLDPSLSLVAQHERGGEVNAKDLRTPVFYMRVL